ncbi:hypothetical protein Poli38472_001793 [Pythium oligandrum]|uniref:Ubiquitin-like domain-containing protein n=1 Tax=Pythium oligandrum TaxID=41045 RepID=A0A8K1CTH2_PYTOL|nr:hypothetical protein Poli38472_001793 [Pythium oligandrum]|eukprot:TMW69637.1 hypothetical protein Poli38472_001793 [Pythium oligandrum]
MSEAMRSSLGLSLALAHEDHREEAQEEESKLDDIIALQEEQIKVKFVLPDDSTITQAFKKGQTVQVLKCYLEEELEIQQSTAQLFLNDRLMLDPLSLTDFKGVENARTIEVHVRIETTSSKRHDTATRK